MTCLSPPSSEPSPPLRQTRAMADLGYDQDFLETTLEPPAAAGEDGDALDYTHFTVCMHPARRLAWWVAWNIDGLTLFPSDSISRSGERFKLDPRVPADAQTGERAYDDNDLDRGHVARRSDLLWGATLAEARQASSDSFFFTNITPQRAGFNQSGRGGVWGLLEDAVLALEGLEDRRVTLFAGPVLAEDDPVYRDIVQLPREHWKVVAYRIGGQVRLKAFLLTQSLDGLESITREGFLDDFDTYQVSLDLLEERTGLDFTALHGSAGQAELRGVDPMLVTDPEQVTW